jgi:hypothetical protein
MEEHMQKKMISTGGHYLNLSEKYAEHNYAVCYSICEDKPIQREHGMHGTL